MLSNPTARRTLAGLLAAVGLLALAGGLGFSLWLRAYLRGDAFRKLIGEKTGKFLRAEGDYMPFHWSGFSVYSDGYLAHGRPGAAFAELRADQVRADFHVPGIFHRVWQINDLEIQRLQVVVVTNPAPASLPAPHEPSAPHRSAWLPDRLDLRRIRVQETDLTWPAGRLRQVRLTSEPEGRAWSITGTGGQLLLRGWPAASIDQIRLRYQSPDLFITDAELKPGDAGNVNVSGQIGFGESPALDLQLKISGVPVTPFLPEDWRAKLHGNIAGEAKVTGADAVAGKLALASAQLEALPVLDRIAVFTQTAQFRSLTLQKATADFAWSKTKLTVTNLVLESEGLLRVGGGFVVENRQLDGLLQVGVTPASLRWLPGSHTRVFTTERAGYVWTPVRVTGPVDHLQEDLSARLVAAAGTELIEGVTGTVQKGARQLLDLLKPLAP